MAEQTLICPRCMSVHFTDDKSLMDCPECSLVHGKMYNFRNSDEYLNREVPKVLEERRTLGLEGLVEGLECLMINVQPPLLLDSVEELVRYTGHVCTDAFEDELFRTFVLSSDDSADILVRARLKGDNPFRPYNEKPGSAHLPDTRLEAFVFRSSDLTRYHSLQTTRGVNFIGRDVLRGDGFLFAQTIPSAFHGTSIGLIQRTGSSGGYRTKGSRSLELPKERERQKHQENIHRLDHTATRVHTEDRDRAIIEFMELTNYSFDFAIYVKVFNSITNVARVTPDDFAMVFTSGILPDTGKENAGPTEMYIRKYGTRAHHMAFRTERIDEAFEALGEDGLGFLIQLVGSEEEGLKQTFSNPSGNTLLVNEYIQRYGDFQGFFTRSNVTLLTGATGKQ